ncbi:uncharacterized protein METZ01_LOCUS106857, partial [marine metagenome]
MLHLFHFHHGLSHTSGWNPEPLFQILSSTPDAVKVKL